MEAKTLIMFLAILVGSISYCFACSCMLTHPQQAYCNSDFVILARIKKEQIFESTYSKVYKVRVRKEFKISEKGLVALKAGRLHTSLDGASCGINLQVGKLYVISGYISSLKARISLCDMIMEWNQVSMRQRKGLRLLYKHGCTCKIRECRYRPCNKSKDRDTCNWTSSCETQDGICLRQAGGTCMWNKNKKLIACRQGRNNSTSVVEHRRLTELPPRISPNLIP